jgi:hypothetical protein
MSGAMPPALSARMRPILLAALVLLAGAPAAAQEPPPEPAGAQYEVEIIVFRHLDQGGITAEVAATAAGTGSSAPPSILPPATQWPALAPAELRLAGVAARLRRGGAYELLVHGGWVQDVTGQSRTAPAALPAGAAASGLAGAVTLYRERYLHVVVDVGMSGENGGRADPARWIRQSRRLRGTALQYFDSPRIGVILAARPREAQVPAQ